MLDFSFESVEDPTINDFDFVHSLKFDSVRIYWSPKLFFCILKYIFAGYNVHHILSCSNISTDVVHISKERYILSANCPATMLGYRLIHVGFPTPLPQQASSLTMKVFSLLHFLKWIWLRSQVTSWPGGGHWLLLCRYFWKLDSECKTSQSCEGHCSFIWTSIRKFSTSWKAYQV